MKTDARAQSPIEALRQYMEIMIGAVVVSQVTRGYSPREGCGWQARPYIVTMVRDDIVIAPINKSALQQLDIPGWDELYLHRACGWPKEPQPVRETIEEAYRDAVQLRHCAIPLSGQGLMGHWPVTEKQAYEILRELKHRISEASANLEEWEVADALEDLSRF